jgi:uncharacterized protein (UPF0333 family)
MNQHARIVTRMQRGQSSMEYIVVCGALVLALGIGMSNEQSVLRELLEAFRTAYHNFSYAISLPG